MKVHYDKDEDILMMVLSDKKVDDSYEVANGTVEVAKDGEPVILTLSKASNFLKNLGKVVPKKLQRQFWPQQEITPAVLHRIK